MLQEQEILVASLLTHSKEVYEKAFDLIKLEDFSYLPTRVVLSALKEFYSKYHLLPPREYYADKAATSGLSEDLQKRVLSIVDLELTDEKVAASLEFISNYIKSKCLVGLVENISVNLEAGRLEEAEKAVTSYMPRGLEPENYVLLFRDTSKVFKELLSQGSDEDSIYLPTLLIDEYIGNGLGPKTLTLVLGTPGRGKTAFACYLAKVASLFRLPTIYVTLEVSEHEIAKRLVASLAKSAVSDIVPEWRTIKERLTKLGTYCGEILIKQFSSISTATLHAFVRRVKATFPAKVLIVDYGDLLLTSGNGNSQERRFMLEQVFADLRDIAVEEDLVVVSPSQANRTALTAEVTDLEHVAESFAKMMIADVVLTLNQTPKERLQNKMRLFIAKNRYGIASVHVPIGVSFSKMHFWKIEQTE